MPMLDLVEHSPQAKEWLTQQKAAHSGNSTYGALLEAVIWTDAKGPDGELIIPIDPSSLATHINESPYPLLKSHDPGLRIGKILAAQDFRTNDNRQFVVALLGIYQGGETLSFIELGFDPEVQFAPPSSLPAPTTAPAIPIATDPREVDSKWVEELAKETTLRIQPSRLSHNAAEAANELIVLSMTLASLVWNPFVTTLGSQAAKDIYALMHRWLRNLLVKLGELRAPILELQSHQSGCQISFIFRSNDIQKHHFAHDALPAAGAQAKALIEHLTRIGSSPSLIVYEFNLETARWYPSCAELHDGRFIANDKLLISIGEMPSHISLGLGEERVLISKEGDNDQPLA